MNSDILGDSSWDTALRLARSGLLPPGDLVRLVRNSWTDRISVKEFVRGLHLSAIPHDAVIKAAQVVDPSVVRIDSAVSLLGFRGAATVAAICFTCSALSRRCGSERTRDSVLQYIIDSIEIGYHFGVSAEAIGPDAGMLLGFGQSVGPALLITSFAPTAADLMSVVSRSKEPVTYLNEFGCEPYQVASLALQRLGFGSHLATAAVMALGNFTLEFIPADGAVSGWWAATEWIDALARGERTPTRKSSANYFPELLCGHSPETEVPLYMQALLSSIDSVRERHSAWTWHLCAEMPANQPLPGSPST